MNHRGLYQVFFNETLIGLDVFDLEHVEAPSRRKKVNKFINEYIRSAGFKDMKDYLAHFPGHKDNEKPEWSDAQLFSDRLVRSVTYGSEDMKHPIEIQFEKFRKSDTVPKKENFLHFMNNALNQMFSNKKFWPQLIKLPTIANARPIFIDYEYKGTKDWELWFCKDWTPDMYKCNDSKV